MGYKKSSDEIKNNRNRKFFMCKITIYFMKKENINKSSPFTLYKMTYTKKGQGAGILSGIIILVIGGLVLALITGIFSLPQPIRIVQFNDEVCPNTLSFSSDSYSNNKRCL